MIKHYNVFISYSREFDLQAAINLQQRLDHEGLSVFRDEDRIASGDRWLQTLESAVEHCQCFIILVGRNGVQGWMAAEVEVAKMRHNNPQDQLPIFPVLLGESTSVEVLSPFLKIIQATPWDGTSDLDDSLLDSIRGKVPQQTFFEGCPFVGLDAYQKEQAHLFFGRQQEVRDALNRFNQQYSDGHTDSGETPPQKTKWLEISGNSGSGKSSLMNAGLLPLIELGWLSSQKRIANWKVIGPLMPGELPVSNLAEALFNAFGVENISAIRKRLKSSDQDLSDWIRERKTDHPDTAFVLAVDQFEELFTIADGDEREQFDKCVAAALQDARCPLYLLTTVRVDFLPQFDTHLRKLLNVRNLQAVTWTLPLISKRGLEEIIDGPARLARLDVSAVREPLLVQARDSELGALPLIENALNWMWEHARSEPAGADNIRYAFDYKRFDNQGGLTGILEKNADQLLIDLGAEQDNALNLLYRLVNVDPDLRQHTRRSMPLEHAINIMGGGIAGHGLLTRLAGRQENNGVASHGGIPLITIVQRQRQSPQDGSAVGEGGWVTLIHETLVRARRDDKGKLKPYWKKLWDYIEERKHAAPLMERLRVDVDEWVKLGFWGRFLHAPGWIDYRRYRKLATLPQEKRFLRAGLMKANAFALGFIMMTVGFAMVVSPDFKNDVVHWSYKVPSHWAVNLPAIMRRGDPVLPDIEKDMVLIEAGSLDVPGREEGPLLVNQPFYMGRHELTFRFYDEFVWDTLRLRNGLLTLPDDEGWDRGDLPVINVSWDDAMAYSDWLGKKKDMQCSLPTDEQWEYAARAGVTKDFGIPANSNGEAGSDRIDGLGLANCDGCQKDGDPVIGKTTQVGSFPANEWGLHDMHGNVWEWVLNEYRNLEYTSLGGDGPRVLRGGSWFYIPDFARSSYRYWYNPDNRDFDIGFRIVCSSPIKR